MNTQALLLTALALSVTTVAQPLELLGRTVTPHLQLESMRYRMETPPADGARVQLFVQIQRITTIADSTTGRDNGAKITICTACRI